MWLTCIASAQDGDTLTYEWGATGGSFSTTAGQVMDWIAPGRTGDYTVTVTVHNPAGEVSTKSAVITVAENRPPVIASLTATSNPVPMGESTTVTCIATDPDGDPVTYSWRTDGGELSGVGSIVTWFAPRAAPGQKTEYRLTVIVEDGNGGTDLSEIALDSVRIVVLPDEVFTPVHSESGTVRNDGTEFGSISWAGDDDSNQGYRAFWSYDLSPLRGKTIARASLEFKTGFMSASHELGGGGFIEEQPQYILWTQLRGLHIYQVSYETGALPAYDPERVRELTTSALFEEPTEIDVTELVRGIATGVADSERFMVMAAFQRETNPNMFGEYISWSRVTLNVMYS